MLAEPKRAGSASSERVKSEADIHISRADCSHCHPCTERRRSCRRFPRSQRHPDLARQPQTRSGGRETARSVKWRVESTAQSSAESQSSAFAELLTITETCAERERPCNSLQLCRDLGQPLAALEDGLDALIIPARRDFSQPASAKGNVRALTSASWLRRCQRWHRDHSSHEQASSRKAGLRIFPPASRETRSARRTTLARFRDSPRYPTPNR